MLLFSGVLTWAGLFKNGKSYRSCWMGLEGGGFLYGSTGSNGLFSGPRIAYIYPGSVKNFEFQIPNFELNMTFYLTTIGDPWYFW